MIRLLYDLVKGKDLKSFIEEGIIKNIKKKKEKKKLILDIFRQIVEGIEFIHKYGIIHSDIKHLNIMIEELDKV
jgi:serine/threonine protein kinase